MAEDSTGQGPGKASWARPRAVSLIGLFFLGLGGLWLLLSSTWSVKRDEVLRLGSHLERNLVAAESHRFRIDLEAGQYLALSVEQRGIDVISSLLAPDGGRLITVDSTPSSAGVETIRMVGRAPGPYSLEITAASNQLGDGSYALRVDELRPATAQDRIGIGAAHSVATAMRLSRQGHPNALGSALKKLEAAAEQWIEAGDPLAAATARSSAAEISRRLGRASQALGNYREALRLQSQMGHRLGQATTLHGMGSAYQSLGEIHTAEQCYEEALELREVENDRGGMAETLEALSLLAESLGRGDLAHEHRTRARKLRQPVDENPPTLNPSSGRRSRRQDSEDAPATEDSSPDALPKSWGGVR